MKILSLNIWGGRVNKEFIEFIKSHKDVDVFCFQEVYKDAIGPLKNTEFEDWAKHESFYLLQKLLPDHELIFHPVFLGIYGLCICIKKTISISETGEVYIYKEEGYIPDGEELGRHARNLQYAQLKLSGDPEPITVINVHGLWNGKGKTDTEERIEQSRRIVNFLKTIKTKVILCGDFNLRLDTESISMIERAGIRNLIREFGIPSTRTSLYNKPEKHADYIFISPEMKVKHFSVMPDEVSDHSPLLLEI
jgi:endonuclease/exonuclease/phosphatase family metal-dependent hydrolase